MVTRLLIWLWRCQLCRSRLKFRDFMEVRVGTRRLFIGHASCFDQLPEQRQEELFKQWRAIA